VCALNNDTAMLIVDENPWLEADSPYAKMLTAHIHIQHFSPFNTASVAKTSQVLYYITIFTAML
jgi:hypothetical protein